MDIFRSAKSAARLVIYTSEVEMTSRIPPDVIVSTRVPACICVARSRIRVYSPTRSSEARMQRLLPLAQRAGANLYEFPDRVFLPLS